VRDPVKNENHNTVDQKFTHKAKMADRRAGQPKNDGEGF
jgi:hypothetical protein